MTKLRAVAASFLLFFCLQLTTLSTAHAAINSMNLGANYSSDKSQITFRVYSSQATRIVLYL